MSQLAYRVAYSALVDRIPDGLTIDHICRTPRCGAIVTHAGQAWRSTAAANVWQPGVYGWVIHTA